MTIKEAIQQCEASIKERCDSLRDKIMLLQDISSMTGLRVVFKNEEGVHCNYPAFFDADKACLEIYPHYEDPKSNEVIRLDFSDNFSIDEVGKNMIIITMFEHDIQYSNGNFIYNGSPKNAVKYLILAC